MNVFGEGRMFWKMLIRSLLCAGLLYSLAACSEKAAIRPKGEMTIGGGVESRR